jgi:phage tail-like protein
MDTAQLSRRGFILGVAGLAATAAAIRPGAALAATPPVVSGAAHFVLTRADGKAYTFTKLVSIISQVDSEEYIYNDGTGQTIHTKQFGKTKPPTVTLEGPMTPADQWLMVWHQQARAGQPNARQDATLKAVDSQGRAVDTWLLAKAWVAQLEVIGFKAGASDQAMIRVKIECNQITVK